jgi:predicted nucleotidyltransferase component of viral defense system
MEYLNFTELYKLQDQVLDLVFSVEKEFYLTGGTCLHRFYKEKRYSDDLDFFTNDSPRFSFAVKNIIDSLKLSFSIESMVQSKQFNRFQVNGILQVDFVNDIGYRHKEPIIHSKGYTIDTIENILSNKIAAIIGRDNPKDIFDIYTICKYYSFNWNEILESAKRKTQFQKDELIIRLESFPVQLLDQVKRIDKDYLRDFESEFATIIEEIIEGGEHNALE